MTTKTPATMTSYLRTDGLHRWFSGKVSAYNAETQVWFLGWEDPLKKGSATHSSILVWEIPWTEVPGSYSPWGHKRVRHDLATTQYQQQRADICFLLCLVLLSLLFTKISDSKLLSSYEIWGSWNSERIYNLANCFPI